MGFRLSQIMSQPSIAVDLGTANTRVYSSLRGEVAEISSAISLTNGKVSNVSNEYFRYMNNRLIKKPLRGGVIVDLENTIALLKPLIKKNRGFLLEPISLVSAPTDTTEKERDLLREALINAGVAQVAIIPEVWVAAIGAEIDLTYSKAQLLIDIGDGVTDMAVFRDGRIIYSSSVRIACSDIQKAVRSAVMSKYKLQIYDHEIERLTHNISAILKKQEEKGDTFDVEGMDVFSRSQMKCRINKKDIIAAIEPVVSKIIRMMEVSLKRLPESIYYEIRESGICLTGGGACIEGMDSLIAFRTNMKVRVAADPIHAVINGAIQTLNYWRGKKCWWENIIWPKLSE